jgi:hypothetical protein
MSEIDPAPTTETPAETAPPKPTFTQPIEAIPDRKFFIKRMVIAGAVLFFAAFLFYDGFVRYPHHNEERKVLVAERDAAIAAKDDVKSSLKEKAIRDWGNEHTDTDILLQKVLGGLLTPVGLWLLIKFLKESKGTLRLEGDILYAPGHPPVPIASITGVENAKWEKKGIAFFDYKLADGEEGTIRVDDFIFVRPPTDAIHDELIAKMPKSEEV